MRLRDLIAAVVAVGMSFAVPFSAHAQSAARVWDKPMTLGVGAAVDTQATARPGATASPANKCGKLRRIAERLGETYAGVRLRQSVVERTCAFADLSTTVDPVWAWPWGQGEITADLPPRLHGRYGAWTINCGQAGRRERCALAHMTEIGQDPASGAAERARIVTHFVIDEIAGQERLLWRVFVERAEPHWFEGSMQRASTNDAQDIVVARVGASTFRKRFDGCGNGGCMMEAHVDAGASAATHLAERGSLQIEVRPASGVVVTQQIDPDGFRQGLQELSRLKRSEGRVLAGK
jgi:invasion protein IalB